MDIKISRKLLNEAMNSGCKTVAELALYLKIRTNMQTNYLSI